MLGLGVVALTPSAYVTSSYACFPSYCESRSSALAAPNPYNNTQGWVFAQKNDHEKVCMSMMHINIWILPCVYVYIHICWITFLEEAEIMILVRPNPENLLINFLFMTFCSNFYIFQSCLHLEHLAFITHCKQTCQINLLLHKRCFQTLQGCVNKIRNSITTTLSMFASFKLLFIGPKMPLPKF